MTSAVGSGNLQVRQLVVVRGGKPVVNGIQLSVRPASVTALMGANGAGKTSTVLAIAGVVPAASGSVVLDGLDIQGLPADAIRRLGLATVREGHQVLRELTVLDNLRAAGGDLRERQLVQAVDEQLALFPELATRLRSRAGDLSGGQQQMVSLAQAMIVRPRFLLIDELSFGLAPAVVARLVPVIQRIAATGVGILLIEQFTTLALALSDHVVVMSRGSVS
ncbi:MAG: ATP-binding cassette domain-containing protein [Chitinophagaceae bacterium]|nr:ATP-binding cassette domain-containing protein [Rubrivivax sp.]